ncbi:MAG TPA: hypothetical protein VKA53_05290 [Thermoanaerobaculia bacterium]|nr:hypothetical protein [Thermoanaerobaculia bacterium]
MGRINWGRVILGGLLAGVIINIGENLCGGLILKKRWDAAMSALHVTMPGGAQAMTIWVLFGFVLGIFTLWLYAAIRPRYGAGVKTALCAGAAVWFLGSFLASVSSWNMGVFPSSLMIPSTLLELIEVLIAAVVGAWVYKEA